MTILDDVGFNGFLIGERFMFSEFPEKECENFIRNIVTFVQQRHL